MAATRRDFLRTSAVLSGGLLASGCRDAQLETLENSVGAGSLIEDRVPTTCWIGKQDCGILAKRINGRVVRFEGHPDHPRNKGTLCPKGIAQIMSVYDPNRVKTPLVRTNAKGIPGQ